MTSDPKRWSSAHGHDEALERALLESLRDVRPPAGAKDAAWQAVAAAIATTAAAASLPPAAAAASSGTTTAALSTGKALLMTIAAGGVALGGYLAAERVGPSAEPAGPRPRSVEHAPSPSAAPALEAAPARSVAPEATRAPARAEKRSAPKPTDRLSAESALLTRARAALRAGDPHEAQRLLQRLASEIPAGVLVQEREVLAIEVLVARGQRSTAVKRAQAFARAYPGSPHTEHLDGLLDAP